MSYRKSIAISSTIVLALLLGLLLWGLMSNADLHIPLLLDLTSTTNASGDPEASMQFSAIGPVLAIALLSAALWAAGRVGRAANQ